MQPFSRIFLLFMPALGLLAGCHTYIEHPAPPEFAGTTLALAGPPDAVAGAGAASAGWRDEHKASVAPAPAPRENADLWIIRPAELPALVAQGLIQPVPKELTRADGPYDWRGLVRAYGEHLLIWGETPYALPLAAEAPVCFYRAGLFDEARQKRYRRWQSAKKLAPAYPLGPPTTWQQYERLAAFLADDLKRPSLPPLPADDDELSRQYFTIASSFARRALREDDAEPKAQEGKRLRLQEQFFFHYDEGKGEPRIASEGFVKALVLMRRLQDYRPKGTSTHPEQALLEGKACLAIANAGLLMRLQKNKATRDQFAVCPVPGSEVVWGASGRQDAGQAGNRVPYLGGAGWLAVVPKASKHPEAAWSLLGDLSGPTLAAQIAHEPSWGGGSVRGEILLRARWGSFGVEGKAAQQLREAVGSSLSPNIINPAFILRTPDRKERDAAVVRAVRAALLGGNARDALNGAAAAWKEMDSKIGKDEALARYRESVRLTRD